MGSSNCIPQNSAANLLVLMIWFDLNLANFHAIRVLEELNHAHPYAFDFYAEDAPAFPTFSTMSKVSALVPTAPRCEESLSWYTARRSCSNHASSLGMTGTR